jgi:hypothetical protein
MGKYSPAARLEAGTAMIAVSPCWWHRPPHNEKPLIPSLPYSSTLYLRPSLAIIAVTYCSLSGRSLAFSLLPSYQQLKNII